MNVRNSTEILYYDMGQGVETFSTRKNSELPYPVLQPHQIHGDEVRIVNNRLTDRESFRGVDALITQLIDFPIGVEVLIVYQFLCMTQLRELLLPYIVVGVE